MKEVILTPEGYEKLKHEIDHLSNEKRREVADRIRIAREFGGFTFYNGTIRFDRPSRNGENRSH